MNASLKIKVCGLVKPDNIREVCALNPDFAGFIFYPGSKRYIGSDPDPEIFDIPGNQTAKVGVFVDEVLTSVKAITSRYRLDFVQLHGTESPGYCRQLSDAGVQVIKATTLAELQNGLNLDDYMESVRFFLFDTPGSRHGGSRHGGSRHGVSTHGGTGIKFNWSLLDDLSVPLPFMLSGGIGPEDAGSIKELGHNNLFGIDVNSRFETEPGIKHIGRLKEFIEEIRKSD